MDVRLMSSYSIHWRERRVDSRLYHGRRELFLLPLGYSVT